MAFAHLIVHQTSYDGCTDILHTDRLPNARDESSDTLAHTVASGHACRHGEEAGTANALGEAGALPIRLKREGCVPLE